MFTINNETWYLKFVPSSHFQLSKTNGDKSLGVCDDTSKTIYLDERLQGALLKKVIWVVVFILVLSVKQKSKANCKMKSSTEAK